MFEDTHDRQDAFEPGRRDSLTQGVQILIEMRTIRMRLTLLCMELAGIAGVILTAYKDQLPQPERVIIEDMKFSLLTLFAALWPPLALAGSHVIRKHIERVREEHKEALLSVLKDVREIWPKRREEVENFAADLRLDLDDEE